MEEAGFTEARCTGMTGFRTSPYTVGALFTADKARVG